MTMASFKPGDRVKVRAGYAGNWFEGQVVHVTDRYVDVIMETGRRFAVKATSGKIHLLSDGRPEPTARALKTTPGMEEAD